MSEKINWTLNVQVVGGPKISASQTLIVDAYDKIDVVIPGGDSTTPGTATVEVQPGGSGQVQFLLITSSLYDANLTYSVDGGSAIQLDAPQLLMGNGAIGLLGSTQNQFALKRVQIRPLPSRYSSAERRQPHRWATATLWWQRLRKEDFQCQSHLLIQECISRRCQAPYAP
jgi:hypothetical protein